MNKWLRPWMGVLLALALVGALGLVAIGCGGEETSTSTESTAASGTETTEGGQAATGDLAADQTLTFEIASEPPSLDPNLATDTTSSLIINNIFEGLVRLNEDGSASPAAAESWDVSDDELTYTFHMRQGATWTNGDPVTSQDFKNSWLRILDPEVAADYAYQLFFIKGAEEYNAGDAAADTVGIETPDDQTLVVTLKAKTPWFLPLLAHQAYFPIPKATVDQFGDQWTEPANIVTNGRFQLTEWNHESDVTITKWADHWDAANVTLETVKMPMIQESTTAVAAWENGELDIVRDLPVADMDRLKAMPEYTVYPLLGTYYYGFNIEHAPLDNVDVRKALALAIDRQTIVDNVTKQGQTPATSFTPEGMPGFETFANTDFLQPTAQVDQAKQMLADAGMPDGFDITIFYNTSESHQAIATAIQSMWKAIGVNASLQNMEWKQYLDFVQNDPETQVYRMGWVADFGDAYNFLDLLRGGGGNNYTRWANDQYDQLLTDALNASDDQARYDIYAQQEDILTEDMPVAPIYWYTNPDMVRDYVQGWAPNALGETNNLETVQIMAH